MVPIEDFPKNHDSEHDFDDQHEVNGRKSCSVLVILTDPDDFRSEAPQNLSARAKKNSKGAPSFAERDYRENPHPETRAGENGG